MIIKTAVLLILREEHDSHSNYFILIPSVNCNTLTTNLLNQ